MLRVDSGKVEIEGSKIHLMSEFTHLVKHLMKCGACTEDDVDLCIQTAKKSDEELAAEVRELKDRYSLDIDALKRFVDFIFD